VTLVDTGPLVALCDARDGRHDAAITHLTRLAPAGLATCDAVLTEAGFHLPYRAQRERLRAVLRDLRIESLPTHDGEIRAEVFAWLLKYSDHEPDWTDGCLAVLCSRDDRLKLWTYDREFRTTWRLTDGRAIPMAIRAAQS
jgi:predicted nucleic acid-binding protein